MLRCVLRVGLLIAVGCNGSLEIGDGDPRDQRDAALPENDASARTMDGGVPPAEDAEVPVRDSGPPDAGEIWDAGPPPDTIGGDRPVTPYVPASYDRSPTPLLIILHGYGGTGRDFEGYVRARTLADAEGFLLLYPDGSVADSEGLLAWAASDFAYLVGLIDEMERYYNVSDVYIYGLSSGASMAYRFACDAADRVSGVIALAGWMRVSEGACAPSQPVPVLHVHGTNDSAINFNGETGRYPAVEEVIRRWTVYNGCDHDQPERLSNIDVDLNVSGSETEVTEYTENCEEQVALWKVVGGTHVPEASPTFNAAAWSWIERFHR